MVAGDVMGNSGISSVPCASCDDVIVKMIEPQLYIDHTHNLITAFAISLNEKTWQGSLSVPR